MDSWLIFYPEQRFELIEVQLMDLFISNMQLFTSQDCNWWTGVVFITCWLLWCFYQLFGLSFWRHSYTAEDPLVSKWCNAKFPENCSDEETNPFTIWMARGWVHSFHIFVGLNIPLNAFGSIQFAVCPLVNSDVMRHLFWVTISKLMSIWCQKQTSNW